jgi:mannosylglycerate hydrolase
MSDLRFTRYSEVQLINPLLEARSPLEAAKNELHIATAIKRWGLDLTPVAEREIQIGEETITEYEFDYSGFAVMVPAFKKFKRSLSTAYRVRVNSKNEVVEVWGRKFDANPLMSGVLIVKDESGNVIPFEILEVSHGTNPETRIVADLEEYVTLAVYVEDVEGLGFRRYDFEIAEEAQTSEVIQNTVTCKDDVLSNGLIELRVEDNGTVTLRDLSSGEAYEGLLEFEDTADVGDLYDYCPISEQMTIRAAGVKDLRMTVEHNKLLGKIRIDGLFLLPESATPDSLRRSETIVECDFSHELVLHANSKVVHVTTTFNNDARDHRLRVLFPSMTGTRVSHANSIYDVIERPGKARYEPDWKQPPAATCPLRSFVSVNEGSRGIAIATKGLLEFELLEERGGTLALTLLRAVGWLSRITMKTRPEAAGPIIETPGGQCPGTHVFEYAIIPHGKSWLEGNIPAVVDRYVNQMCGIYVPKGEDDKKSESSGFLSVWPETLQLSAFKVSEDNDKIVVRVWNVSEKTELCTINLGFPVKDVVGANLDETVDDTLEVTLQNMDEKSVVALNIPSRKVITLLITPQKG